MSPEEKRYSEMVSRPGWQTTEFWISTLLIVGAFLLVALDKVTVDQVLQLWPMFATGGAYAVSRGMAKRG